MILLRVRNMTFRTDDAMVELLPYGAVWVERDFPDANMLILPRVARVANTHWHSDHVGGNARFQQSGAEVFGAHGDADALRRADTHCCVAEYLDQPVPVYTVDHGIGDGDRVLLGDTEWTVVEVPGHTSGHLA